MKMKQPLCLLAVTVAVVSSEAQVNPVELPMERGYSASQLAHYEALSFWETAVRMLEKSKSPHLPDALESVAHLYFHHLGNIPKAEEYWQRSIALREASGSEYPSLAVVFINLANAYSGERRFEVAEQLYRRALAIQEKSPESFDGRIGVTLTRLGDLCRLEGRYMEAEQYLVRAERLLQPATAQVEQEHYSARCFYRWANSAPCEATMTKRNVCIRELSPSGSNGREWGARLSRKYFCA
jgi:tetratricopeptide (TPR) repeat protein